MGTGGGGHCIVWAIVTLVLVSLAGSPIEGATLDLKLHAGDYQLVPTTENRERIAMPGFGHLSDPGKANLPSKIFLVAIPPGTKVDSVSLVPEEAMPREGTHHIAPAPMVAPLSTTAEQIEQLRWEYDQKVAAAEASDEPYPARVAEYLGPGGYRKYNLVQIRFTPFSYRAKSAGLSFHPSVAVTVHYSASAALAAEAGLMAADNTPEAEALAREMIVNYDRIQASYPVPPIVDQGTENGVTTDTSTGFVIVTTDALEAAVQPLVNWEKCKGRSVHVRTVEDIEAAYSGDDRAEKIRNLLRDKLATWSIVYVMLIGDLNTVPMCPAYKEGPCGWGDPDICWEILDYTPTDYYYAELSLPDSQSWDSHDLEATPTRGEQAYDLIQFPNEVNVGRIPLSDPTAVESICRKMAEYEYSQDTAYKYRYLFASGYFWPDTDGAATSEYTINNELLTSQFPPVRIYEHEVGCYQSTFASEYDMSRTITREVWGNQFDDGYFGFVDMLGHGSAHSLGFRGRHPDQVQCPEEAFFHTSDRTSLNDAHPAMVFGGGCSTAEAEVADNLPSQLLQRGAVGFVGPTRTALGTHAWVDPSSGSSQSLNYWFCHYAITHRRTRLTFGAAFQYALRHMYNDHGWNNDWGQFFEWNFFGNPDMSINPRPANLPDLETFTPSGWTSPLVPRRTGDATSSSCVLSTTLPGGTDDTYFSFACRNAGTVTTPTHQNTVYLDGRELISRSVALGGSNSSLRLNETSVTAIAGGRHTLSLSLDVNGSVWEISEADNCWARQYVWSPPLLADAEPQDMPAPAEENMFSCAPPPQYPNCDGFSFAVWPDYPTPGHQWSAVCVSRPVDASCSLRLWAPGSYTGSTAGFGPGVVFGPLASTGQPELIVVNGAVAARGTYYVGVSGPSGGSADYRIEKTSSVPITTGTNGSFIIETTGGAAQLFEIALEPGTWRFVLDQRSSTSDLGMTVYSKDASIAGRTGTGTLGTVNANGVALDETLDVAIPSAGTYALAVWKVNPSDFSRSSDYQITVGLAGDAGIPWNPSPADGATGRSVASDLDWADCANAAYYRVYMRAAGEPSFAMIGSPTDSTLDPGVLEYATTYEWYVLAYNVWNQFTLGPTWSFTTMTEPDLVVVAPNGGESWAIGEVKDIEWTSNNCRGLIDIQISRSAGLPGTWETIASNVGIAGSFPWTVTGPVSSQCRVKILGGICTDTSDADFAITFPGITVTAPSAGESWYVGEVRSITWTSLGVGPNVRIELSRDDGSTWTDIVASTPDDGSHKWTVTSPTSIRCFIRVSDAAQPSVRDISDGFAIRQRSFTLTAPNGGQNWPVRSAQNITWASSGLSGNLRIELSRNGGTTWHTLAEGIPLTSPWTWPFVTPPASTQCLIRLTPLNYPSFVDISNAVFTVSCNVAPDFDGDCDVDADDWLVLEACMTGPAMSYQGGHVPEGCGLIPDGHDLLRADFDADGDVDPTDFGVFQRCISGADPADPDCAN